MNLEALTTGAVVRGILPDSPVTIEQVRWHGSTCITVGFRGPDGRHDERMLFRDDEPRLALADAGHPWAFDADGGAFRLAAEALRIRMAHLFDPLLAVHSSTVEPLPHQITAVYEAMLPRQPLRFLLADDPGAGKTIMAGLLVKELIARGDLRRCLIVCPGSLVEQWQDELASKFQLHFEILTNDKLDSAEGNWFLSNDRVIARLDKLARDESVQQKLLHPEAFFDLILFDEAHKLSASMFGGEAKYTRRYQLAQKLGDHTRNLVLLTATPHNGKDEDFQLFLRLLDADRFEGTPHRSEQPADCADLMRRMVKEDLRRFDGRPLFPERIAYTVSYELSDLEAQLYHDVTEYVRTEFDRAEAIDADRRGTVGFALTVLQRRLASSPAAIHASLQRRHDRLVSRRDALRLHQRGAAIAAQRALTAEEIDDLDDGSDAEVERVESELAEQSTAARTLVELEAEIATLVQLVRLADDVRRSGRDAKWTQLSELLSWLFAAPIAARLAESRAPYTAQDSSPQPSPRPSPSQKLVVFTEHRDTLEYLRERISTLFGDPKAVAAIHGGLDRDARRRAQNDFLHDPEVRVLLATDAAGEGVNLQRAHLMVNYDLPWNPNRIEQRFGRIHRIGQSEVCHLWNLVAADTREGDVYRALLTKLEESRRALGGRVFDVLGGLQFDGRPLRDLLVEAIRYGDQPHVRARLNAAASASVDLSHLRALLEDHALAHDALDTAVVARVRADMERAHARRLQPHYIGQFFRAAFEALGGAIAEREAGRFEIGRVPALVRQRAGELGARAALPARYERMVFDKERIDGPGPKSAAFVCPGHPLLDAVLDLTLERQRAALRSGAVLVDEQEPQSAPRVLFFLEHVVEDGASLPGGGRRSASRRLEFVEIDAAGVARALHYAPYLDYRALRADEPSASSWLARPDFAWIAHGLEDRAVDYAAEHVAPAHYVELRAAREAAVRRTRALVQQRLTHEIAHWDNRAEELRLRERAGKAPPRLNSGEAARRADALTERLQQRMRQLDLEVQLTSRPPVVLGAALIVPAGLLVAAGAAVARTAADTQASAARARAAVMAAERALGHAPVDREFDRLGYDIESVDGFTGHLRFIEVKGRDAAARTITVTRNEILTSLNQPERYLLALVRFDDAGAPDVRYIPRPFEGFGLGTDFSAASVEIEINAWEKRVNRK